MNERIRELLKQSTNPPWDGEQGPMNEFNLERFAELIVQECITQCEQFLGDPEASIGAMRCAITLHKLIGIDSSLTVIDISELKNE
jgi:hypothetical protein